MVRIGNANYMSLSPSQLTALSLSLSECWEWMPRSWIEILQMPHADTLRAELHWLTRLIQSSDTHTQYCPSYPSDSTRHLPDLLLLLRSDWHFSCTFPVDFPLFFEESFPVHSRSTFFWLQIGPCKLRFWVALNKWTVGSFFWKSNWYDADIIRLKYTEYYSSRFLGQLAGNSS